MGGQVSGEGQSQSSWVGLLKQIFCLNESYNTPHTELLPNAYMKNVDILFFMIYQLHMLKTCTRTLMIPHNYTNTRSFQAVHFKTHALLLLERVFVFWDEEVEQDEAFLEYTGLDTEDWGLELSHKCGWIRK